MVLFGVQERGSSEEAKLVAISFKLCSFGIWRLRSSASTDLGGSLWATENVDVLEATTSPSQSMKSKGN